MKSNRHFVLRYEMVRIVFDRRDKFVEKMTAENSNAIVHSMDGAYHRKMFLKKNARKTIDSNRICLNIIIRRTFFAVEHFAEKIDRRFIRSKVWSHSYDPT